MLQNYSVLLPICSWELPNVPLAFRDLPLPNPLGAALLFDAPKTLLHSGSSLLPLGAPKIYKFQNTPLLFSIQSLSVHEYTLYQDKKSKKCLQYFNLSWGFWSQFRKLGVLELHFVSPSLSLLSVTSRSILAVVTYIQT